MNVKNKIFITFIFLLIFILFFNTNNVFASDLVTFECNVEEAAWNKIIELPEYISGNNHLYIMKFYSNYKVFFVEKVSNYKCYLLIEDGVSKYGIPNTREHLYFNQPVKLNIYKIASDGSTCTKEYTDTIEESFICINPYDHAYSSTTIYTDNTYTTPFFQAPVTEIPGVQIPALETAEQIPEAIVKTLMILIPVGLIVLSIGLVIYLIKRVIYSVH